MREKSATTQMQQRSAMTAFTPQTPARRETRAQHTRREEWVSPASAIGLRSLLLLESCPDLLRVEVEVSEEVSVLAARNHADVVAQQLLLQELLGQVLAQREAQRGEDKFRMQSNPAANPNSLQSPRIVRAFAALSRHVAGRCCRV